MRGLIIGAVILASAGPAGAQATRCGWEGSQWVCRQDPQLKLYAPAPPRNIVGDAQEAYLRAYQQASQARAEQQAQAQDAEERGLMIAVAAAVREGRCDDAKQIALAQSRLDIADQAARVCTPR